MTLFSIWNKPAVCEGQNTTDVTVHSASAVTKSSPGAEIERGPQVRQGQAGDKNSADQFNLVILESVCPM